MTGHGVIDNVTERGYWLPVDAKEAVPTNWVSNDDITAMLKAIRAMHSRETMWRATPARRISIPVVTSW